MILEGLCASMLMKTKAQKAQNAFACTEMNSVGRVASIIYATETVLLHPIFTDYSVMAHYDIA